MMENKTENTAEEVITAPEQEAGSDKEPSVKKGVPKVYIVTAILVVVLIATGFYFNSKIRSAQQTIQTLSDHTSGHRDVIEHKIRELEENIRQLSSQMEVLQNTITDLNQQQPGSNEDWALSEIEYLLIIATHRLQLENDFETALAAMEAGLLRLESMGNPELLPVREQLVSDINNLKEVNVVDISGLSIYLADLIERADKLPLKETMPADGRIIAGDNNVQDTPEPGWSGFINSVWHELKSLVEIKKTGELKQELLLPDQEYFLYQNLRLELENARLSALKRDSENFHTSVSLIMKWLEQYYDVNDHSVMNVLDTLKQMSTIRLNPDAPDINSSLETLRAYMRSREISYLFPDRNSMVCMS